MSRTQHIKPWRVMVFWLHATVAFLTVFRLNGYFCILGGLPVKLLLLHFWWSSGYMLLLHFWRSSGYMPLLHFWWSSGYMLLLHFWWAHVCCLLCQMKTWSSKLRNYVTLHGNGAASHIILLNNYMLHIYIKIMSFTCSFASEIHLTWNNCMYMHKYILRTQCVNFLFFFFFFCFFIIIAVYTYNYYI